MPLRPPSSALAVRTMKDAFEDLGRTITPSDYRDLEGMTLQDVKKAALEIEQQLAARGSLRNMRRLLPLFSGLEHYAHVIAVLCNGTPFLPWVWAPISLVLRVASEYAEAFEQIIRGYSRIAESLGRFHTLSQAIGKNQDFQQTLAVYYTDILQFHSNAYKFVRRASWKVLFLTSWGRFQRRFGNILENLKRHEELIDLQANAHNVEQIRELREDFKSWRRESLEELRKRDERESAKQYESIVAWLQVDESAQISIQEDVASETETIDGTSTWILKNPRFKSWLQPQASSFVLWVYGAPGWGKSVLSSQIARYQRAAGHRLVQHYCSQRYAISTSYDQTLRSLLLQLLREDSELIAHVYESCVFGKKPPTVQTCESLILTLFSIETGAPGKAKNVWMIIDGLNECDAKVQTSVINLINKITAKTATASGIVCKVLVSCRNSTLVSSRLRKMHTVSLSDEKHSLDTAIRQYVTQRLLSLRDVLTQLQLGQRETDELGAIITRKSDGMFLYARLMLDYLSRNIQYRYTAEEVRDCVEDLPEELSGFYQKILKQMMAHLNEQSIERLRTILGWISFSKRPLKRIEFLSALTFCSGSDVTVGLVPQYVLEGCSPLVEERQDTTINFIHFSVKEFLQSSSSDLRINEVEATVEHLAASVTCLSSGLRFFLQGPAQTRAIRVAKGIHALHLYATEFWTEYIFDLIHHGSLDANSLLSRQLSGFVTELDKYSKASCDPLVHLGNCTKDQRIHLLDDYPLLQEHVKSCLTARSLQHLEHDSLAESEDRFSHRKDVASDRSGPTYSGVANMGKRSTWQHSSSRSGLASAQKTYQDTIRFLLEQDECPGVSATELEAFKSQFKSSAFTCRLQSCPRATQGFETDEARHRHEITHTRLPQCTVPGCHYPAFRSRQSLKQHLANCHQQQQPRRSIRRQSEKPESKSPSMFGARLPVIQQSEAVRIPNYHDNPTYRSPLVGETGECPKQTDTLSLPHQPPLPEFQRADTPLPSIKTVNQQMARPDKFDLSTHGYRICLLEGCGQVMADSERRGAIEHFWARHHTAIRTPRGTDGRYHCLVIDCIKRTPNNSYGTASFDGFGDDDLNHHYLADHTRFGCRECTWNGAGDFSIGRYASEQDLEHHWMTKHAGKVERWVVNASYNGVWYG